MVMSIVPWPWKGLSSGQKSDEANSKADSSEQHNDDDDDDKRDDEADSFQRQCSPDSVELALPPSGDLAASAVQL